jgi:hypothetical protein
VVEDAIVLGALVVAVLVVGACAANVGAQASLPVGPPNWDFTKSWATNIAVLGAVFGTFFSNAIVPTPRFVPSPGYPLLSAVFAVLALISPVVFLALSRVKAVYKDQAWDVQYQGIAAGFLFATFITLWAALGQIITIAALGTEVLAAGKVPGAAWALLITLLIAIVATATYVGRGAGALLVHHRKMHARTVEQKTQMTRSMAPEGHMTDEQDPTRAPLPGWTLL